jgi:hypothetical protein
MTNVFCVPYPCSSTPLGAVCQREVQSWETTRVSKYEGNRPKANAS